MKFLNHEFKHHDKRRILTQLLTSDIKQINTYEAVHGAILGDHFHKETIEYFYILSGVLIYNNKKILKKGDLFVVEPEEKHSLLVKSDKAVFMTFLTKPYTKENPDIHV